MKTIPHIHLLIALLVGFLPFSTAEARRPRGTTMTGVVQSVDHATRWIVLAQDDGPVRRFVYGKLASFWHGGSDARPSHLQAGMRVQLNLHNPLIGPDFATQIVLLHPPSGIRPETSSPGKPNHKPQTHK